MTIAQSVDGLSGPTGRSTVTGSLIRRITRGQADPILALSYPI